jgi:Tol biopolymer transport system component
VSSAGAHSKSVRRLPRRAALALLVLFLTAIPAAVESQSYPLTKVPWQTFVVDYEPFWSPDGSRIVLISSRHGGMKVHLMDASEHNGAAMRQLTTGDAEDDSPAWSPDGRRIAFVSIRDGASRIFVVNADGSDAHAVTGADGEDIHPMWAPDGSRILFNTTRFSNNTGPGGNGPSANGVVGEKIDERMDLATIRPDGADLRRLTQGGGYTYASFSPDGRFILHRKARGALSQIFLMNSDGSGDHNLSSASSLDGWPAWSPDGGRVVFARHVGNSFQIFVMSREGADVRQLTAADGSFTNPRWSPDGRTILCSRRSPPNITLFAFPAPPRAQTLPTRGLRSMS